MHPEGGDRPASHTLWLSRMYMDNGPASPSLPVGQGKWASSSSVLFQDLVQGAVFSPISAELGHTMLFGKVGFFCCLLIFLCTHPNSQRGVVRATPWTLTVIFPTEWTQCWAHTPGSAKSICLQIIQQRGNLHVQKLQAIRSVKRAT